MSIVTIARRTIGWGVALAVLLAVGACDETPITPEGPTSSKAPTVDAETMHPAFSSAAMANSDAPFQNFHQGFNHGVHPWNLFTLDGSWCGSIERKNAGEGSVRPSAGRAYATVEAGQCVSNFFPGISAPASGPYPPLLSSAWPTGGFVHELDVYLDPMHPGGIDGPDYLDPAFEGFVFAPDGSLVRSFPDVVFTFAASVCVLGGDGCVLPGDLRYFAVSAVKEDGTLEVAGHEVSEPGWYTLRFRFASDGGELAVDFQLIDRGQPMFTEPVETTYLSDQPTSGFDATDIGSGYLWFASVADGLELPIDEHRLRRGR